MGFSDRPAVERRITGFHQDELGDWIANLECGHSQHVRHNPPWENRAWVVSSDSRAARVGRCCPALGVPSNPVMRRTTATDLSVRANEQL